MKDERIRLNVGGTPFHCFKRTLTTFPNSRLAKIASVTDTRDDDDYDVVNNEYFFDRNPLMFSFILEAYRTGSLHLPRDLCGKVIRDEMSFWGVKADIISACCWKWYYKSENDIQAIQDLTENYFKNTNLRHLIGPERQTLKTRIWLFLDEPRTSKWAMIWAAGMMLAILFSIIISGLETLDVVREPRSEEGTEVMLKLMSLFSFSNSSEALLKHCHTRLVTPLVLLDGLCFLLITIDVILRVVTCSTPCKYLKNALHIFEILSIVDFWIVYILDWNLEQITSETVLWVRLLCKAILCIKVARFFRLCRYLPALNVMELSVRKSRKEIYAFGAVMLILIFIFSYLVLSAEYYVTDSFDNAFVAIYWAVITLTTVGYGDVAPKSPFGRFIACVCAVCGLISLALPVGVIAANFNSLYSHHNYAEKHIKLYNITSIGKDKGDKAKEDNKDCDKQTA